MPLGCKHIASKSRSDLRSAVFRAGPGLSNIPMTEYFKHYTITIWNLCSLQPLLHEGIVLNQRHTHLKIGVFWTNVNLKIFTRCIWGKRKRRKWVGAIFFLSVLNLKPEHLIFNRMNIKGFGDYSFHKTDI